MKISSNTLADSNATTILYKAHVHWTCFLRASVIMAVGSVSIPLVLIDIYRMTLHGLFSIISWGLFFLFMQGLKLFLETYFTRIIVYKDRLSVSKGWMYRRETDLPIRKLQGSHLTIPFLGRFLKYGRLHVSTTGFWCTLRVSHPRKLRDVIVSISK